MKTLIAVMSCAKDQHTHQAIRDTWAKRSEVDYAFFMGNGVKHNQPDEVILCAPDDYEHVTEKSRAIFEYALARGYDFVLHCARDTYVDTFNLVRAGLFAYDYSGHRTAGGTEAHDVELISNRQGKYEYTSGGAGTWLSAKSMRIILDSDRYHVADDLLYGWILGDAGIRLHHDPRFLKSGERIGRYDCTVHLGKGTGNYDPSWMYKAHRYRS